MIALATVSNFFVFLIVFPLYCHHLCHFPLKTMIYSFEICVSEMMDRVIHCGIQCKPRNLVLGRQQARYVLGKMLESSHEFVWQVRVWCSIKWSCTGFDSRFQIMIHELSCFVALGMIFFSSSSGNTAYIS